jgi:hypothetical protein
MPHDMVHFVNLKSPAIRGECLQRGRFFARLSVGHSTLDDLCRLIQRTCARQRCISDSGAVGSHISVRSRTPILQLFLGGYQFPGAYKLHMCVGRSMKWLRQRMSSDAEHAGNHLHSSQHDAKSIHLSSSNNPSVNRARPASCLWFARHPSTIKG